MTPIQVIGIGLEGACGLPAEVLDIIEQAVVLAGSDRHLSYFPHHSAQRWPIADLETRLQDYLQQDQGGIIAVLTSGDPLFFGLGRQLLQALPADAITFHPHVSSLQLAFNRVKLPWQNACLVSAHGRSLDRLEQALKRGSALIGVLTDGVNTPSAIARLVRSLALPTPYRIWICENLGGMDERVQVLSLEVAQQMTVRPLNVVILQRVEPQSLPADLPVFGIPDSAFLSFQDRPGLMTKREVRVQVLAALGLHPNHTVWDIGAGTGSVSIETARLVPQGNVWAIEKTAMGCELICQNAQRFDIENIRIVRGQAPECLGELPDPHRVFVGGSGQHLTAILDYCAQRLRSKGHIVVALATLENMSEMTRWLQLQNEWQGNYLQVALSRSVAVGALTRWTPLNPVILVCLSHKGL
ncbi:precorrin-6y C5,15-methyltransferase (decarboxylating) subunit CbiE [Oscillatoria sp. CS-180]|uniref:precorrin-6y C5,15-methyltransferase (decarboxylating) subunit CbiE n=1 Tax=Oscillatoria sp. CS-180 TaxID=3021720 RepID=UPI00232B7E69|nr:precorrin-6y C5,15-methyltransferase (decarboxylating) subunit CbiE [Oscillatoria sp. CS-180]MDB9529136.1 precorrin-6y C5,15-methyltransferase (decarboxylating) subunit CbiE [Oscillatoria sp. CS-180]